MSENNFLTPLWTNAGADAYWWYTFHDNRGAQYAEANCLSPDAQMMTTAQGEELNEDGTVTYFIWFHNYGPKPCYYNLNVGGLT